MKPKITLETLATGIAGLTVLVRDGNKSIEARLDKIEVRLDKVESRLNKIETRLDQVELSVHGLQDDVKGLQDEMKGVHKVLDRFNTRITRLEKHVGLRVKAAGI